jgi:acyl-CoA oxidase
MPPRHGAAPVNHAITSFNHVFLPSSALLGSLPKSVTDGVAAASAHSDFLASLWRVGVGTLALSAVTLPALQIASTIAYRYSARRMIHGPDDVPVPIIAVRTQQAPVFTAVAQAYVLRAFYKHAVAIFVDQNPAVDPRVKHAVATVFKAVALRLSQTSHWALSERCGAQGLFACNQIISQLVRQPYISQLEE